mgnify:CR=1 FL=1|jgi:hypothetical protein
MASCSHMQLNKNRLENNLPAGEILYRSKKTCVTRCHFPVRSQIIPVIKVSAANLLIKLADAALREAKLAERTQVVIAKYPTEIVKTGVSK